MPTNLRYFVQFRDQNGAVVQANGASWFAIEGLTFATTSDLLIGNTVDAGRIDFGPLSFTLQPSALLPRLFNYSAAGRVLTQVEIAGYDPTGTQLRQNILLKTVGVAGLDAGDAGAETITLQYGGLLLQNVDADGHRRPASGWNRIRNTRDDSTRLDSGTDYGFAAPLAELPTAAADPGALTYFVQFRDSNGTFLTGNNGEIWFAIAGLSFTRQTAFDFTATSPTGPIDFGGLSFTLEPQSALSILLTRQAAGTFFQRVEIAGYAGTGTGARLAQNLMLGSPVGIAALGTGSDGAQTVTLEYGTLVERSYARNNAGNNVLADSFTWDSVRAVSNTNLNTTIAAPLTGTPAPDYSAPALRYFVQFRDQNGAVIQANGASWFAIEGLKFATASVILLGNPSSAGRIEFGPLSFTLQPSGPLPRLFNFSALGRQLTQVEIAGYDPTGTQLRQNILLKTVGVAGLDAGDTGAETVTLQYGGLLLQNVDADGNRRPASGWDRIRNTRDDTTQLPGGADHGFAAALTELPAAAADPGALTYFVQFRDSNGTILSGNNGETWFAIAGLSFTRQTEFSFSPTISAGRIQLGGLSFALEPQSALSILLARQAAGTFFQKVEIAGYAGTGTGARMAQNLMLISPVGIAALGTGSDGAQTLTLEYGTLVERSYARNNAGNNVVADSFTWDSVRAVSNTSSSTTIAAPLTGTPAPDYSAPALRYFVQFRDQNGAVIQANGASWFVIEGLTFATTSGLTLGTPSSAGRVEFGPLSFTLQPSAPLPKLFSFAATGRQLTQVEIAGYDPTGAQLRQNILLKTVGVASLDAGDAGAETVTLQYGGLLLQNVDADGRRRPATGWNRIRNTSDNTTQPLDGSTDHGFAAALTQLPTTAADPGALTYVAQFRDSNGIILSGNNGETWFAIAGLSFTRQTGFNSSTLTPTGPIDLGGLSFTLEPQSALSILLTRQAAGTFFQKVEIAGYAGTGADARMAQNLMLISPVGIAALGTGSNGAQTVTLEYGTLVERSYARNNAGDNVLADTSIWDSVRRASTTASNTSIAAPLVGVACFLRGTRILTARGEVAVEHLAVGERIPTAGGGVRQVRWIGYRTLMPLRHARPWDVMPVRVAAGAFGPGRPHRDLVLSPDHAVHVAGALVPVRYLLNGATITQEPAEQVTYYHVELADADGAAVHDVLLAEGLACESFLDTGNRSAFAKGGPAVALHPHFAREAWAAQACAPLVRGGRTLVAVRAALHARAQALGHATTADPDLCLWVDGRILPATWDGDIASFAVPARARDVRLVSRGMVPAQLRPESRDHRRLGVAVTALAIDGCAIPLDDPALAEGWHDGEPDLRWTDGDAALPCGGGATVAVTVALLERYWLPLSSRSPAGWSARAG